MDGAWPEWTDNRRWLELTGSGRTWRTARSGGGWTVRGRSGRKVGGGWGGRCVTEVAGLDGAWPEWATRWRLLDC